VDGVGHTRARAAVAAFDNLQKACNAEITCLLALRVRPTGMVACRVDFLLGAIARLAGVVEHPLVEATGDAHALDGVAPRNHVVARGAWVWLRRLGLCRL
jgi:hypothetical protein